VAGWYDHDTPGGRGEPSQRIGSIRTNCPHIRVFPGDSTATAGPGDGKGHGNVLPPEGRNGKWPDRARAWKRVGQGKLSEPAPEVSNLFVGSPAVQQWSRA